MDFQPAEGHAQWRDESQSVLQFSPCLLDTGKNDLMRRVTHREAVFGTVIHSIFDAWHYEVIWTGTLTRLL